MNRKQRRKLEKEKSVLHDYLEDPGRFAELEYVITKRITRQYDLVWLLALRDEYGFGKDRTARLGKRIEATCEALAQGYLDFADIETQLIEEGMIGEEALA